MNTTPKSPAARRNPIVIFLGACLVTLCSMSVCLVLLVGGNAGYWMLRQRSSGVTGSQPVQSMQTALDELPQGDSQAGEQIFSETGGCSACHSLQPGERKVGPSLAGIAHPAALPADYSPEMYIYEAITSPATYVVAGYPANVMPEGYGRRLSKQELADLLAFLMTK